MELLLAALLGAAPQVQNRAPRPDELGYRPEDGAAVSLTPPSFAWLHEPAARTYAVQWAAREDWSVARRFTVPPDAVPFPMPTRAERRERVLRSRPRLFVRPEDLPPPPEPRAPTDLPPSKVFRGIGVASLHVTLLDAAEDVHVLFKSSPFGSRSHGHNAQNGFQLNAYGEALLPACTFRDLHGSAFHRNWVWNTISQNSVLVDGRGQGPRGVGSPGRISAERLGPDWDYVAGDAAEAYEGRLTRFRRHVLFVKPDVIVLCDDLEAREPSIFQFLLHAYSPFEIDPARSELRVERPRAGAVIRYFSPVPLAWRQWDGYEPPPMRDFPNLWHAEAATREKLAACRMLTVIVPHRAGRRAEWRAERTDREDAAALRFERGEEILRIEFPREGLPSVRRERRGARE